MEGGNGGYFDIGGNRCSSHMIRAVCVCVCVCVCGVLGLALHDLHLCGVIREWGGGGSILITAYGVFRLMH